MEAVKLLKLYFYFLLEIIHIQNFIVSSVSVAE